MTRARPRQPDRLLYVDHEIVNTQVWVIVRMVHTRPGRTDIPIGLPMRLLLPGVFWLDETVGDAANTMWDNHQRMLEADARRAGEEAQAALFESP